MNALCSTHLTELKSVKYFSHNLNLKIVKYFGWFSSPAGFRAFYYTSSDVSVQIGKFNLTFSVLVAIIVVSKYFENLRDIVKSHFRVFLWTRTKKFVPIERRDLA